jgi:hypothetical protein
MRLTEIIKVNGKEYVNIKGTKGIYANAERKGAPASNAIVRLAAYEDAEEQGRLVILPCKVGDKVRDKIADYVFTVERIELGHKSGTIFRCGNPETDDYMAFYDFEIGEKIEILTHTEAALKGEEADNDV